jgi:hypothetical protein
MRTPSRNLTAAAIFLLVSGALAALAADDPGKKDPDRALIGSYEAIRQAFRTRQVSHLSPILPSAGKVYLSVKLIAVEPGYYSRDQVEALVRQAFSALQTVRFHINMDLDDEGGSEKTVVVCPALWSYTSKGVRGDVNLRFLLSRQQDRWMLAEIRETR